MNGIEDSLSTQLKKLEDPVKDSLNLWDIPKGSEAKLLNVSENFIYLVKGTYDFKAILRVHRENYNSEHAIESELKWKDALKESGVILSPSHYLGKNGKAVQQLILQNQLNPINMVLFEYIDGQQPDESGDLREYFKILGEYAARMHVHSINWELAEKMSRHSWDVNSIFGLGAKWGNWRDAPQVTSKVEEILEQVENLVKKRLEIFGKNCNRFGLIHSDMRIANLIVDHQRTWIIDFDDCGFGWYLYDFAASISFMENDPRIPELKQCWLEGYTKVRALETVEIEEIDTMVMLRRLALLAWIGSHIEAPEPKELADGFAKTTAELGEKYLYSEFF